MGSLPGHGRLEGAKTGVLTRDLTAGGIVYLEMPLAALERGLDLIR